MRTINRVIYLTLVLVVLAQTGLLSQVQAVSPTPDGSSLSSNTTGNFNTGVAGAKRWRARCGNALSRRNTVIDEKTRLPIMDTVAWRIQCPQMAVLALESFLQLTRR